MLKLPEGRALLLPCGWLTATHAFLLLLLAHGLDSLPQECHHPRLDHAACSGQSGLRGGAPDAGPESPILSSYTPFTSEMSTVDGARGVGRDGSDRHTPGWLGRTWQALSGSVLSEFDTDNDGTVSAAEFKSGLHALSQYVSAHALLVVSLGSMALVVAAAAGTALAVLVEDAAAVLSALKDAPGTDTDASGTGFSALKPSFWQAFQQRAGRVVGAAGSAARIGWRNAADRVQERGGLDAVMSRWIKGSRPVVYVVCGYVTSQWLSLCAQKRMRGKYQLDRMTALFLQTVIKYSVLAGALTYFLKALGIPAHGLDALLASGGIAAGIASQKILQNLASGVVLLIFRPFKIGDKIALPGGIEGWVTELRLFETRLVTDDRRTLSVPNADIYNKHIENLTAAGMRRVQVDVFVAGSASVAATRAALVEAIAPYAYLAQQDKQWQALRRERERERRDPPHTTLADCRPQPHQQATQATRTAPHTAPQDSTQPTQPTPTRPHQEYHTSSRASHFSDPASQDPPTPAQESASAEGVAGGVAVTAATAAVVSACQAAQAAVAGASAAADVAAAGACAAAQVTAQVAAVVARGGRVQDETDAHGQAQTRCVSEGERGAEAGVATGAGEEERGGGSAPEKRQELRNERRVRGISKSTSMGLGERGGARRGWLQAGLRTISKSKSQIELADLLTVGMYHELLADARRAPEKLSALSRAAMDKARALTFVQGAGAKPQHAVQPLRPCAEPFVVLKSIERSGMWWRAMIWVPALEHDKWYVTINEALARTCQDKGIRLVSQALEDRGALALQC